jgi:predicted enzyme related to lactoylglutathione lyase
MAQQSSEHGHFYWNELMTRNVERDKKFYADALGWDFEAMSMPDGSTYWVAKMGGKPVGGMFDISATQFGTVPEMWMSYIAVDDVDVRVKKAEGLGATLMKPIFDVPGVGRIAILKEPGSAGIGWMTPASH